MHLVAAVFALTVFALWRASTTKRQHTLRTHTSSPPSPSWHTHKQKQYKFILPRLPPAGSTALGHSSLGAQPAAQNLSTLHGSSGFAANLLCGPSKRRVGEGGGHRGEWVLPLHSELIPWNAEQKQRKVLIRLLFATLRYGLFSFPLFLLSLLSSSLPPLISPLLPPSLA